MTDPQDPEDERELLSGFVDWFRGSVVQKLDGLDLAEATRVSTPTGLTLLGIVKHLTWVEHVWFSCRMVGGPMPSGDNAASFVIGPDDTVASVLGGYREACDESRRITAATPSLDDRAVVLHDFFGAVTLRWILVHMVDETAAHKGHMDILRELTDGRTG